MSPQVGVYARMTEKGLRWGGDPRLAGIANDGCPIFPSDDTDLDH